MDDHTDKHSAKDLKTDAQRTMANIHVGGVEKLLLSSVFFLLFCDRRMGMTDLKLILPSSLLWPDLTTIKWRIDQRKLFHGGDTISALMSPSENKSVHVDKSVRMLTL
jgi:hypothetical protein